MVFSTRLKQTEVDEVRGWLSATECDVFFAQAGHDQRHGYHAARFIAAREPLRKDLIRAALLHDIGKRHANLGPVSRSLVSAYVKVGGSTRGRWQQYLDHGEVASSELDALGAEPAVVDFARHHHGARPASIPPAEWDLLQAADGSSGKAERGRR